MKDFIKCFMDDALEKMRVIMKVIMCLFVICVFFVIVAVVIHFMFEVPFWNAFSIAILIPVISVVSAILWEIGERVYCWLWWRNRRRKGG